MLKRGKQLLLHLARSSGGLQMIGSSNWRRQRLLILCYHSVSIEEEHLWRPALYFEPSAMEARFRRLEAMKCTVLPFGDAIERAQHGTLPERAVALTFDDGMYDFWSIIWPMLRQRGWPATLYASTYYAEKRLPLFPLLCSYLLWKGRNQVLPGGTIPGQQTDLPLDTNEARRQVQERLLTYCEGAGLDAVLRNDMARRVAGVLGIDVDEYHRKRLFGLMTAEEVAEASRQGVDVQLHTHRHRTPRDRELFLREIDDNRLRLEKWSGRRLEHFCYPSGVYYPEFLPWLTDRGIKTATTCVPGMVTANSNSLLLPRLVDTSGLSGIEFDGWLAGLSDWLPQRRL